MKKTIILIIAFSLIISSAIPVYADDISTSSAINSINSIKAVSDTKAAGDTVDPVSSSGYRYQLITNGVGSTPITISKWADIVTQITQSIAYSSDFLRTNISSIYGLMTSYFINHNSTGYYYWDWTPSGGVYQGAPESAENITQAIRAIGTQLTKTLSYNTEYAYQTYQSLLNGLNISFSPYWDDVKNALDPNSLGGFPLAIQNNPSQTLARYRQQENGGSTSDLSWDLSVRKGNALGNIFFYLATLNTSAVYFFRDVSSGIATGNTSDVITNSDLTTTSLGRVSIWSDIRKIGGNLSNHLARLDYVLASDDEIAAREAAQDNQDAFINDFLDSNGAGSASTSDIGDMSGISSSVQDILSTGVSPTSAFSSMDSNSSAWDWFKNDTKNALDTTSSNRRNIKSSDSDTPLLDNYYSDLQEKLKVYKK